MVKAPCRICAKATDHTIVDDFSDRLPPHIAVLECRGCGVLGVHLIANESSDV